MATETSTSTTTTTTAPPPPAAGTGGAPPPAATQTTSPPNTSTDTGKGVETPKQDAASGTKPEGGQGETPPAELKLTVPKDVTVDADLLKGFEAWAKENSVKGEVAQKLLDLQLSRITALQEQAKAAHQKQVAEWDTAVKADKELGGDGYAKSLETAKRGIAKFASPELAKVFEAGGIHPEQIRAWYRVGKALAEDSVGGSGAGAPPSASTSKEWNADMYPTMSKKE